MAKRKYVEVNVSWSYGECSPTAKVPPALWDKIQKGATASIKAFYWYEGNDTPQRSRLIESSAET